MFWFPRVCQNPLKGAIPDPAPIKRVGNLPSTNGLKWKPGLDFKYMATFSPTGMFAKKFEQNPPNFLPVSVWYSTTLSKRSKRTVLSSDFERYSLELAMLYNLWRQHRIFYNYWCDSMPKLLKSTLKAKGGAWKQALLNQPSKTGIVWIHRQSLAHWYATFGRLRNQDSIFWSQGLFAPLISIFMILTGQIIARSNLWPNRT